jgi:hypothetical protein
LGGVSPTMVCFNYLLQLNIFNLHHFLKLKKNPRVTLYL